MYHLRSDGRAKVRAVPKSENLNEKWCSNHKKFLDRCNFNKDSATPDGLSYICKECRKKVSPRYNSAWRANRGRPPDDSKHGMTDTQEYMAWEGAKARCSNRNKESWPRYGGRGIRMCEEWRNSFLAFYLWVGPKPSPEHSIDRIDNNGDYEPGNVRWATMQQQVANRRPSANKNFKKFLREFRELHTGGPA